MQCKDFLTKIIIEQFQHAEIWYLYSILSLPYSKEYIIINGMRKLMVCGRMITSGPVRNLIIGGLENEC